MLSTIAKSQFGAKRDADRLLLGFETSDDAAVWLLRDGLAAVLTVDFFTPVVDDPYEFGRVAAANALSDVFAMGAVPHVALNLLALDSSLGATVAGEILRGGVPSLARQGLNSLATVCLNLASGGYGDAAIAAMSIVTRVMMMAVSAIIGFGQGFQPICGFNYGAGLYERVRKAFWFCVKLCFCVLVVVSAAAIALAPQIISLFLAGDPQVQEIGTLALRLQCALIPLFAFTCLANMMLQTMGIAGRATLLAMARQGLCFIPAVWLLEHAFGLLGVQLAQPVADFLSFLLAIPLTLPVLRGLREKEAAKKVSKP